MRFLHAYFFFNFSQMNSPRLFKQETEWVSSPAEVRKVLPSYQATKVVLDSGHQDILFSLLGPEGIFEHPNITLPLYRREKV
jgi:hypothetical protein